MWNISDNLEIKLFFWIHFITVFCKFRVLWNHLKKLESFPGQKKFIVVWYNINFWRSNTFIINSLAKELFDKIQAVFVTWGRKILASKFKNSGPFGKVTSIMRGMYYSFLCVTMNNWFISFYLFWVHDHQAVFLFQFSCNFLCRSLVSCSLVPI